MEYWLSYNERGRLRRVSLDEVSARRGSASQPTRRTVPTDWEMFTSAGNKSVAAKATRLINTLAEGHSAWLALEKFFRSFKRLYKSKNMTEAGDTAVREGVLGFAMQFRDLIGGDEYVQRLWDDAGEPK